MPLTDAEIKRIFGAFSYREDTKRRGWIIIDPAWLGANMVDLPLPFPLSAPAGGHSNMIRCHRLAAPHFQRALQRLKDEGHEALIRTYDGCLAPRHIDRNRRKALSRHSWGIAIDLNAGEFPLGSKQKQCPLLVAAFVAEGFEAGETWKRPDPMHFELVAG